MSKERVPLTKHQKGRRWATATLVICGAFSIYANVRSGQFEAEPIVVSVFTPIVAFLSSHLITYFSPKTKGAKFMIYGGFGLITLFAMMGSGWHIVETVQRAGQNHYIAIIYVFITDAPMLLAAAILIEKVPTGRNTTVKVPTPTASAKPKTTPKRTPAKKATSPAKTQISTKTDQTAKAADPHAIVTDPFEKQFLNA